MVVNPYSSSQITNPFNPQPSTTPPPSGSTPSFEQQLSTAISDSLRKLGVNARQVNITITNNGTGTTPAQIVISYSAAPAAGSVAPTAPLTGQTASPPTTAAPTPSAPLLTDWSPWDGPRDKRDTVPQGGGLLTASGAPKITLNTAPAPNQYNYSGPAARNPYFTTPSNPLRGGYVLGFQNWFLQPFILGAKSGPVPANKVYYSTEEGAQEALRIVQQFQPDAEVVKSNWTSGIFTSSVPMYYISLPGGRLISAGGILNDYYNGGSGVSTTSDEILERSLRLA